MSTPIQLKIEHGHILTLTTIETSDKPFVQPDRTDPNIIVFDGYKNIFGNVEPKVYTKRTQFVYNLLTGISYSTTGYY